MKTQEDLYLGGRIRAVQPVSGYRAGTDAVLMAAAVPVQHGKTLLEFGCGAGVALACVLSRRPDLRVCGLEIDPEMAALAQDNLTRNNFTGEIITGDIKTLPDRLKAMQFDHVMMNPPYYRAGAHSEPDSDSTRYRAHIAHEPVDLWLDEALKRLKPGGILTIIHLAELSDRILHAIYGRVGATRLLPIVSHQGEPAVRIIIQAIKGRRTPFTLLSPLKIYQSEQKQSQRYLNISRDGGAIEEFLIK